MRRRIVTTMYNNIFNLLCAVNCQQPMKKFIFSVTSRATGRLQIKPSSSGDENDL